MYYIGIDLGTTNSVLSFTAGSEDRRENPAVELLPIEQLVDAATVEARTSLPSFIYLGEKKSEEEKSSEKQTDEKSNAQGKSIYDLPWASGRDFAVGAWAVRLADSQPTRIVDKAKSWLCYNRIDRHEAFLPWTGSAESDSSPDETVNQKISPVEASCRYLEHLVSAWNFAHPEAPMNQQSVVLTVPASFDAAARELTREAALSAGLPENFTLLEEPQAAVYAWLAHKGDKWRKSLSENDVLLVCDVGGGTSDFSLVNVEQSNGELILNRLAVGNHLLVGGDNMDLAVAWFAAEKFAQKGVKLNPWQNRALQHAARTAKERLLSDDAPESHTIAIAGRGRSLIASTVSVEVTREEILQRIREGFFPVCKASDKPIKNRQSGFQQIGLPYESDAAVTRHLSAFLQTHLGQSPFPTHVLFNGGVFKSSVLRQRLFETISSWRKSSESDQTNLTMLDAEADLDNSVALGAAYYAWSKVNGGIRIKGSTARAYYVGIETAGLAIPGMPRPLNALCVASIGMEEGTQTEVDSPSMEIGLVVGQPEKFRFFSSSVRKDDKPGTLLTQWDADQLQETDSLETTLKTESDSQTDDYVPVKFHSVVTELGMFELWCQSPETNNKWKLEFSVRED